MRAFAGLLGEAERERLAAGGPRVVSIGPVTSATAREQGLRVDAEAAEHSIPGLVAALLDDASRWERPVVALLTDYGPGSEHVGALHAVVAAGCPGADRVDLAHDVPPGDVRAGALLLRRLAPLVPRGRGRRGGRSPASAPSRRAVAVALAAGGALVGPDNGLLGPAARALGAARGRRPAAPAGRRPGDLPRPGPARPCRGAPRRGRAARRPRRAGRPRGPRPRRSCRRRRSVPGASARPR